MSPFILRQTIPIIQLRYVLLVSTFKALSCVCVLSNRISKKLQRPWDWPEEASANQSAAVCAHRSVINGFCCFHASSVKARGSLLLQASLWNCGLGLKLEIKEGNRKCCCPARQTLHLDAGPQQVESGRRKMERSRLMETMVFYLGGWDAVMDTDNKR